MPRKRSPEAVEESNKLLVNRDEAAAKLADRIAKGRMLIERPVRTLEELETLEGDVRKWDKYNSELLRQIFSTSVFLNEYNWWGAAAISMYQKSPDEKLADQREDIREKVHRLESVVERLELIPLAGGVAATGAVPTPREHSNKVFVVHGHDEAARESVARFLERLGIEAVVLHEQPNEGRSILEKLEHYSDVDFAVVLLTPDDLGATKGSDPSAYQSRARQNVVLELGYFIGKLGRAKVCALHKAPIELPSDFLGVVYVPLDVAGGWRLQVAKELRVAGFNVDLNQAL